MHHHFLPSAWTNNDDGKRISIITLINLAIFQTRIQLKSANWNWLWFLHWKDMRKYNLNPSPSAVRFYWHFIIIFSLNLLISGFHKWWSDKSFSIWSVRMLSLLLSWSPSIIRAGFHLFICLVWTATMRKTELHPLIGKRSVSPE